jgi:hypothetical protein
MKKRYLIIAGVLVFLLAVAASPLMRSQEAKKQVTPIVGANYLYIEDFEIAPGTTMNKAIAEGKDWVTTMRKTGEFKSVRLYIHNTGPRFAVYVLAEPKSWQSIETGSQKFFAAYPDFGDKPVWFTHSDNLLGEIPVE